MNLPEFERWLRLEKKFAPATVYDTVQVTKRLLSDEGAQGKLPITFRKVITRLEAFADETGDKHAAKLAAWARPCLPVATPQSRVGGKALRAERDGSKRKATSIDDATWEKLRTSLRENSIVTPHYAVLRLMAATALRVSDVLRITTAQLNRKTYESGFIDVIVKNGKTRRRPVAGAKGAWYALLVHLERSGKSDVAGAVSPDMKQTRGSGGTGAIKRVERALHGIAVAIGSPTEIWTHRIRRTVLVHAYEITKDKLAVRDLADHEPQGQDATDIYLREAVPKRVAELQKKLNAGWDA